MMNRKHRSVIWKLKKEFLEEIVQNAQTYKEILEKLGLRQAGGNFQTLKSRLIYEGIPYDHIPKTNKGRKYTSNKLLPIEELFRENSPHVRKVVRERVLRDTLIPYKCSICGLEHSWNGMKLVLVLDHINGISNDHRLENLRFLCPNCNSQQDTFAGRNTKVIKKINYCIDCGKVIASTSTRCKKCYGLHTTGPSNPKRTEARNKITKEQLLGDILNMSIVQIGKKYNVSDNAVRKWCKSFGLPCYAKDIKELKEKLI